jgi:hypothetical protein
MLDGTVAHKIEVARSWFNKVRTGRMVFTVASAETFEQLLRDIECQANAVEGELTALKAANTVAEFSAALHLPHAAAIAAAPNVVRLTPKPAKGGGR